MQDLNITSPLDQVRKHNTHFFVFLPFLLVPIFVIPHLLSMLYSRNKIFDVKHAPKSRVAIVFGAGLRRDGTPTSVLKDRVDTASHLYFSGKVEKLLMSGANHRWNYNEPFAMKQYAISLGIPEEAIVLDFEGQRTYDTCFRAGYIFDIQDALLVTQFFHLPRAIFTCNMMGVKAYGVMADQRKYSRHELTFWQFREIPATLVAFIDVWIRRPVPTLGEPQPIFPPAELSA